MTVVSRKTEKIFVAEARFWTARKGVQSALKESVLYN